MKRTLLVAFVVLACLQSAIAGEVVGRVVMIQIGHGYTPDNVYALMRVDVVSNGQPSCATDPRFAINPATPAGKALLA